VPADALRADAALEDTVPADTLRPDAARDDPALEDTALEDTELEDTMPADTLRPDAARDESARDDSGRAETPRALACCCGRPVPPPPGSAARAVRPGLAASGGPGSSSAGRGAVERSAGLGGEYVDPGPESTEPPIPTEVLITGVTPNMSDRIWLRSLSYPPVTKPLAIPAWAKARVSTPSAKDSTLALLSCIQATRLPWLWTAASTSGHRARSACVSAGTSPVPAPGEGLAGLAVEGSFAVAGASADAGVACTCGAGPTGGVGCCVDCWADLGAEVLAVRELAVRGLDDPVAGADVPGAGVPDAGVAGTDA